MKQKKRLQHFTPLLILLIILVLSLYVGPQKGVTAAYASGQAETNSGTQIMNSRGESMQLDFQLYDPGTEMLVDYEKYGTFSGEGTDKYVYKVTDRKGLAAAVGEGVYPNNSVNKDPAYRVLVTKGKLKGSAWDYVYADNQMLTFYKWASTSDTPAVQQFYTAQALENLGQTAQAIKAYHAILVHFPKQVGWSFWHTPLYMSRLAYDRIDFLTRNNPELGIKLVDADIQVQNGYNADINDDVYIVNPGRLVKADPRELKPKKVDLSKLKVVKTVGTGRAQLVEFENGHWQMQVDGKPFMIKGVAYAPTPVGRSPNDGDYDPNNDWMDADLNKNGKPDGPYDSWVDVNKNNRYDSGEPVVGDFQLLKEMGVNTIRIYHHAKNKETLRKLYKDYGINVIMGDMLGMYGAGSGAKWYEGTDYTNPAHRENMMKSVRAMVEEYKDEPYVLMWVLGNESNYGKVGNPDPKSYDAGLGSNAKTQPEAHYAFVNEVAGMIKSLDPTRPIVFSNGDTITVDLLGKHSDNIDVFGSNAYRGWRGFGLSFWKDVRDYMNKPVLLTEYGCPACCAGKDQEYAEQKQMEYHEGNWKDMLDNSAGYGFGNCVGGIIFEFVDEWWKTGLPPKFSASEHEKIGDFAAAFPDGWMHEEWLGVVSQGDGKHSPYLRQLRKAYEYYKKAWNQ